MDITNNTVVLTREDKDLVRVVEANMCHWIFMAMTINLLVGPDSGK